MKNEFIQEVYDTLNGAFSSEDGVPGVVNLFALGEKCELLYRDVYDAQRRLEKRLDVDSYDADVELIINRLTEIQQEMCYHMYCYGAKFGEGK